MKKILLVCVMTLCENNGMYLWESRQDQSASCCLYVNGLGDICNPYIPCTRNLGYDLHGIADYINRLLISDKQFSDKGTTFSYVKMLKQTEQTIAQLLSVPTQIFYRFDIAQRHVTFVHDIVNNVRAVEKNGKTNGSLSGGTVATEKQKQDDVVLAYMIKLGLARPLK